MNWRRIACWIGALLFAALAYIGHTLCQAEPTTGKGLAAVAAAFCSVLLLVAATSGDD